MGVSTGIGSFRQGLGNDLLGGPGWPATQGLGAALQQGQQPGSAPVPAPAAAGDDAYQATDAQASPVSPRLTDENVDRLNRILTGECQGTCNASEIQGVGSSVINRMNRAGTDRVLDVTGGKKYAVAPAANPDMTPIARALLSGRLGDNTGGATNIYSPRSMPREDGDTKGWDVGGGLEQTPGLDSRNYSPGFANGPKKFPQNHVPGARDYIFKFYTQPGNGRVH